MSRVVYLKVPQKGNGVQETVRKAMKLGNWASFVKGPKVFVKINAISPQLVPGQNTSPWVVEGVLQELLDSGFKVTMGDADLTARKQLNESSKSWGFTNIAEEYGVKFVNLTEDEQVIVKPPDPDWVLKEVYLAKSLIETDSLVTVPVAKTHGLTKITCALKNQWGCISRDVRSHFHPVADRVISEINRLLRPSFAVADGTICMEGKGPRTGVPKICDFILVSNDLVALDTVFSKYMGLDPFEIETITESAKLGVGSMNADIIGDLFESNPFKPPELPFYMAWEMRLRRTPLNFLFHTPVFGLFCWLTDLYSSKIWYALWGKKLAKPILNDSWYGEQWANRPL